MPSKAEQDQQRYEEFKRRIANLGFVRRGSVVKRFMPCGKAGCCCQATPPQLHGPYYQWTRKVRGKTLTLRLTEKEARLFAEWIANGRQLDGIIAKMESVSLRATDRLRKRVQKS